VLAASFLRLFKGCSQLQHNTRTCCSNLQSINQYCCMPKCCIEYAANAATAIASTNAAGSELLTSSVVLALVMDGVEDRCIASTCSDFKQAFVGITALMT
jgi:hypothetical protein